jgi:orotidine-5'-phosphate decarboxylase
MHYRTGSVSNSTQPQKSNHEQKMSSSAPDRLAKELSRDRLIVALDVSTPAEARSLVAALRDVVGTFKIGSQLFTIGGPELVREIVGSGVRVFLDLKFHDIPHQIAGAARAVAELGVSMFTVHASGGTEMMRRAVEAVAEVAESQRMARPVVLGVTVLTSVDSATLAQIGIASTPAESVLRLAKLAEDSGLDGVVASPREALSIRNAARHGFLVVTPGIRPAHAEAHDQKRFSAPADALRAGADYLVIGRPITAAENPSEAARMVLEEMDNV